MSNCSGRGMVRKRMYDRGHGMVRWVSWILQLMTEICCTFAAHLLRICYASAAHVRHQPQAGALDLLPGKGSAGV